MATRRSLKEEEIIKREGGYACIPSTAGIQVGGEEARRGRAQVVYTRTLLAAIPLPLFLSCFFFSIHTDGFCTLCIVFLELLPSTDGVRASSVNLSGFIVPLPPSPTNTF